VVYPRKLFENNWPPITTFHRMAKMPTMVSRQAVTYMTRRLASENLHNWLAARRASGTRVPSRICKTICENIRRVCTMKSRLRKDSSAS